MSLEHTLLGIVAILATALLVGVAANRLRFPYIVALLVVSLPISLQGSEQAFVESFLLLLLPTLIFEASWNFHTALLRRTWKAVSFMAIAGVLVTTLTVGGGLALMRRMPLLPGLLLGAIIAPTDPIAVIATFKRLAVPQELAVIVEGESLFNDGVGIVLYVALSSAVASGIAIEPFGLAWRVVLVAAGGAAIGAVLGALSYVVASLAADRDLHVLATIVAAYGGYLLADEVHASGIFAAIFAAIVYRWLERRRGGDPQNVEHIDTFWGLAAFLANSVVFLLVGLRIELPRILAHPGIVLTTLGFVVAARLVCVYGALPLLGVKPAAWRHVVALSGIRGGVSIALALALPEATPYRGDIVDAVYGVVAVTILVQGLGLAPVMKRLRL
jgi:CPA1 family monovalent cation:H+ antiporter